MGGGPSQSSQGRTRRAVGKIPTEGSRDPGSHGDDPRGQKVRVPTEPGRPAGPGTHRGPASAAPQGRPPPGHRCPPAAAGLGTPGPVARLPVDTEKRDAVHTCPAEPRGNGLPPGLWGASGPHRPYTARLLLCLAGGTLGGPHGLQNAAVGGGGLDGPLDEAVLVDPLDDAVRGSREDPRVRVGAPPTSRASACPAALDSRPCTALCACPASSCHPGPRLLPGPCRDTGLSF